MEKNDEVIGRLNTALSKGAKRYEWNNPDPTASDYRFQYEHDESEIIYSNSLKRLSSKSQIIVKPIRDHFRSRLSHTLEVREIAFQIGKVLGLNTPLISAIALGHDLGHAPFGHAGEKALQRIVRREVRSFIGIKINEEEEPYCFHHASNSARLLALWLDQTENGLVVTKDLVEGALRHSWSPWKGTAVDSKRLPLYGIPTSYEAQVVAVADQLAAINHDTEDLLEAFDYTHYSVARFDREMKAAINNYRSSKNYTTDESDKLKEYFRPALEVGRERGYGRKERIEKAIGFIIKHARPVVTQYPPEEAKEHPIAGLGLYGEFLDLYENFIRDILETHTWFIGRNSMADSMVTTVFNHLWPAAQACVDPTLGEETFEDQKRKKKRAKEPVEVYRDHFKQFFEESYRKPARKYSLVEEEKLITEPENLGLEAKEVWTTFLMSKCLHRLKDPDKREKRLKRLVGLISLVHFVSGLTDRYCLEIFNATHDEFLATG